MRQRHLLLACAAVLGCAGPASQPAEDAGVESGRSYSDHTHEADVGAHSHGDPNGPSAAHAHGVAVDSEGGVTWATHEGVFRLDPGSELPVALHLGDDLVAFVRDPHEPGRYWASASTVDPTGELTGFVESVDGGRSWELVWSADEITFDVLAVGPQTPGFIAAAGGGSLWLSTDSGRTWESWDWPGDCTGIVVLDDSTPTVLLSGVWGIASVVPGQEPEFVFPAPVTAIRRSSNGIAYALAGSTVECGDDVTAVEECRALGGIGMQPIRQIVRDPSADERWYALTAGTELYRKDGDAPWELVAAGL